MTWSDLVALFPLALAVAFSPVAIIEMILVLFSKRRVLNSIVLVIALAILNAVGLILDGLLSVTGDEKLAARFADYFDPAPNASRIYVTLHGEVS